MPEKKYNLIYADPPWSYAQKSVGRGNRSGALDKYDLMSNKDIRDMDIEPMCQDDALLFLWTTTPLLPEAIAVIEPWGFTYKTYIIWEKEGLLGMGNWVRVQTEMILVGVRGKVKPFGDQRKNIHKHPVCAHSAKPHYFRQLVEGLAAKSFPELTKLELFARSRPGMFSDYEYEGWDVYGNQVNNSITI